MVGFKNDVFLGVISFFQDNAPLKPVNVFMVQSFYIILIGRHYDTGIFSDHFFFVDNVTFDAQVTGLCLF